MNINNLKTKLAETFHRSPKLRAAWILVKNVNNEMFVRRVNDYGWDVQTVYYEKYGEEHKGKTFGLITDSGKSGFFAVFNRTLMQLYYCYINNLIPIVRWSKDWIYSETEPIHNTRNPWEYYFNPCSEYSVEDIKTASRVAIINENLASAIMHDLGGNGYRYSRPLMDAMAVSLRKWVRLNTDTQARMNNDIPRCIFNEKTLGVHIRGGGMLLGANNHPIVPKLEKYIEAIEDIYSNGNYEKIFVATDDNRALNKLIAAFGDEILVYYKDVIRVDGVYDNYMLHNDRENNNYLNGYEVLRDAYTLAACNGILSGLSQVSIAARIIGMSTMKMLSDDIIIDEGIHLNGIDSQTAKVQIENQLKGENL